MKLHQLGVDEALRTLGSSRAGLRAPEVTRRRAEFGQNVVERAKGKPPWVRLTAQFTHFFALILWVAAALSFAMSLHDPASGMWKLGAAIVIVILINGVFSFAQEHRAERALSELQKLLPRRVRAVRDGAAVEVSADELVPGDLVLLEAGDQVPADCRVIDAHAVRVNTSAITGESAPESRDAQPSQADSTLSARNVLLAGTFLVAGSGAAVVFATGMLTEFGRIARLTQAGARALSPLQKEIVRLGRIVAVGATALGALFFVLGGSLGLSVTDSLLFAVGIIVANVPEGLLPTVTLSLAMASQRMARKNALVRRLASVETLGCATVICTDKTGTLTQNRMKAVRMFAAGAVRPVGDPLATPLLRGAQLCHSLVRSNTKGQASWLGDPTEIALVELGCSAIPVLSHAQRLDEVAFDSERKRYTSIHRVGDVFEIHTKGALETVLPLCTNLRGRDVIVAAADQMASEGLRVLAFAHRDSPALPANPESELTFDGLIGLSDPPRPEVRQAIARCRSAGIRVIIITGDHPRTAAAIARDVGLPDPIFHTGHALSRMTDVQLQLALDDEQMHFARTAATDKRRIVEALRRKGHVVAVTGDGVNDAPALKAADIGVAMGRCGTDVARETADLVLVDDNFATIVDAIEEGRAVFANIRKFLTYILTSNVPELVPYLAFVLLRVPLALTVMQILAVDLGTDMLPALALGAERADPDVMQKPPRGRHERLIDRLVLLRSYAWFGLWESAGAMAAFFAVHPRLGYVQGTTACLAGVVVMQVANVFICRSNKESVFTRGLLANRLLLPAIAFELLLIAVIVYTPAGRALFGTAPLPLWAWLPAIPFAIAMIAAEEIVKAVRRAHTPPRNIAVGVSFPARSRSTATSLP